MDNTNDYIYFYADPEEAAEVVTARCVMLSVQQSTLFNSVRWYDSDRTIIVVRMWDLPTSRRAQNKILKAIQRSHELESVLGGVNRAEVRPDENCIYVYIKTGKKPQLSYEALMHEDSSGKKLLLAIVEAYHTLGINPESASHICWRRHEDKAIVIAMFDLPKAFISRRKLGFWLRDKLNPFGTVGLLGTEIKGIMIDPSRNEIVFYLA